MPFSRPASETPFRILVLGDFGASAASPRPLLVDRDNVDKIMQRLDVRLELPGAGTLRFKEVEDFHPDRLFESFEVFRGLRGLRADVANPETFRDTASQLSAAATSAKKPAEPDGRKVARDLASGSLLDDILDSTEGPSGQATAPARRSDPLQQYITGIVAQYVVPAPDPRQADMLAQVDAATADTMRTLLHNARFQALEAAWRALNFLVRNTETSTNLKIYVLHLPKDALSADLLPASDLRDTRFYKVLVEETVGTPGAEPWALVAANYVLGPSNEDVELAGRMALLAGAAGCPVIARADAALLGDAKELASFSELQKIPEARYLGLALPGFMLRMPYGKETSPSEKFEFEEIPGEPKHRDYLWGNPSIFCAVLIAEAFAESGWEMRPGDALDISGLPAHVYKKDGESVMKPCAEVVMTESDAGALMDRGLIPLLSIKNTDRVHVAGFRSIAGTPLGGHWN